MTVKKIALLGLASVATLGMSIAMAGGPAACAPAAQESSIYLGLDVGAFHNNTYKYDPAWANGTVNVLIGGTTITAGTIASTKRVPWGWTASGLIGYEFDNNWALQFGYIWNQKQQLNATVTYTNGDQGTGTLEASTFKLEAYSFYLAVNASLTIWNDVGAYFLAGPAWTHLKQTATFVTTANNYSEKESFVSPMAAVGLAWAVDDNFSVNLQYMLIMSDQNTNSPRDLKTVYSGTQRATVGMSYAFVI